MANQSAASGRRFQGPSAATAWSKVRAGRSPPSTIASRAPPTTPARLSTYALKSGEPEQDPKKIQVLRRGRAPAS